MELRWLTWRKKNCKKFHYSKILISCAPCRHWVTFFAWRWNLKSRRRIALPFRSTEKLIVISSSNGSREEPESQKSSAFKRNLRQEWGIMNKLETPLTTLSTHMQSSSKSPNPSPDPDIDDASSKRQATRYIHTWKKKIALGFIFIRFSFRRVFKKSSANGKITVYLGKRDFVDHITHVDPIGEWHLNKYWVWLHQPSFTRKLCVNL